MTAFLASHAAAWAQSRAAESTLPIGSPITIISDETVDSRVRPYSEFRAHLRDALEVGGTLVATAGTSARIVVLANTPAADGTSSLRIAITHLNLGEAGTLPVRPQTATLDRISAGMAIPAQTLAAVGLDAGKVRVLVPLPFTLSNETPNPIYTPAPLRTANPITTLPHYRRHPGGATPSPSPAPSATVSAPATASSPNGSGTDAGPNPGVTNPPAGTPVFASPTPPGPPLPNATTPQPLPT